MTLKIYGMTASRALRNLWMAQELGLSYEHVPVALSDGGTREPAFLALNPNGQIPAIDDDGLVLWESFAINLYLARKHGGPLAPASLAEEGQMLQWTLWAVNRCERDANIIVLHRRVYAEPQRDLAKSQEAGERLKAPLAVLDSWLQAHEWLVGGRFTVADLNVAAVLMWARAEKGLIDGFPHVKRWVEACMARPAFKAATAR